MSKYTALQLGLFSKLYRHGAICVAWTRKCPICEDFTGQNVNMFMGMLPSWEKFKIYLWKLHSFETVIVRFDKTSPRTLAILSGASWTTYVTSVRTCMSLYVELDIPDGGFQELGRPIRSQDFWPTLKLHQKYTEVYMNRHCRQWNKKNKKGSGFVH